MGTDVCAASNDTRILLLNSWLWENAGTRNVFAGWVVVAPVFGESISRSKNTHFSEFPHTKIHYLPEMLLIVPVPRHLCTRVFYQTIWIILHSSFRSSTSACMVLSCLRNNKHTCFQIDAAKSINQHKFKILLRRIYNSCTQGTYGPVSAHYLQSRGTWFTTYQSQNSACTQIDDTSEAKSE